MLTRDEMVARMLGADPTANGCFIVAVKTTGIYCLPSCRPPRKPKPENVTFYETPTAAREVGFRACKLCHPDAFYDGHHAAEALIEGLVAGVARDPGAYRGVGSLATAAGVGISKLHELIRDHYHTSPADLLARARVAAACCALLGGQQQVAEIAFAVGFESLSAFNDNFRKYTALSPLEFRRLRDGYACVLVLPPDYPIGQMLRYLGRDPHSLTERVAGQTYSAAIRLDRAEDTTGIALVQVEFSPGAARCRVETAAPLSHAVVARLHEHVLGLLGLHGDPTRFEAQVAGTAELAPLLAGQRGLRVPLIADPFDALIWAIVGQQVTRPFAFTLRHRLIAHVGTARHGEFVAPPTAAAVAALEPGDLAALGFSRAKADYLSGAARAVADGGLPLGMLAGKSFGQIERALLAVRGLGPWSTHYVLMRHFGFLDCVPLGDAGLTTSLQRFFALAARPGKRETLDLMARFTPYRSLATFHLWQRLGAAA